MIYRWKLSTESTLVSGSQTAANWAWLSLPDLQDVFYELPVGGTKVNYLVGGIPWTVWDINKS